MIINVKILNNVVKTTQALEHYDKTTFNVPVKLVWETWTLPEHIITQINDAKKGRVLLYLGFDFGQEEFSAYDSIHH